MTDLMNELYSAQQILIPPNLPLILKKYAKAAIRTQPRDLLLWSYYYFKAVANGLPPPAKERIEYPLPVTVTGLTPGFLKVIFNQIGSVDTVSKEEILEKWDGICLEKDKVEMLFKVGNFPQEVNWEKFLAIAAGSVEQNLTGTMSLLCELLTEEPEGGSSMIPIEKFLSLYKYLATLDCGPVEPSAVSSETLEEEHKMTPDDIHYSEVQSVKSGETWDTLLREMGQQDSEDTLPTDDMREVDSKAGLVVWPDMLPDEIQLKPPKVSPRVSEEFITSDTGLQVWDEDQFQNKIATKIDLGEDKPYQDQTQEEEKEEVGREKIADEIEAHLSKEYEQKEEIEEKPVKKDEIIIKESNEDINETDSQQSQNCEAEEETNDQIESGKEVEVKAEVQTRSEDSVEPTSPLSEKEEVNLKFIMEPDPSMILVPTPLESNDSICTDQRSIKNVTESEDDPSVGQKLMQGASLKDLKIGFRKVKRGSSPSEWAKGDYFWTHLPGIGPIVPQHVIDEVEVFLRQCAGKQCGMVMPRNLRHFLCPSLDGLGEDVYLFSTQPECSECCAQTLDDEDNKIITVPTSEINHYIF